MSRQQVLRHGAAVRIVHWLAALSGLLLCFSGIGFMPLYGRFYLNDLPGFAWVANFDIQLSLHYGSALGFSAAVAFHLLYHLRRGETAAWPRRGDLRESWEIVKAMVRGGQKPPHGKFLAEQRLAYAAIGTVSLVLILTGLLLSFKNGSAVFLSPTLIQVATLLHLATTFVFLALVALHVAAFALRANRPLLPAIFGGRVSRSYAEERHPRWKV